MNSRDIIALMREFPFTLQVEDPATAWTDPPERYTTLAEHYRPLVPDGRLMFDVNVVPDRQVDATHLPASLHQAPLDTIDRQVRRRNVNYTSAPRCVRFGQ